jgi:hypothetical protein
MSRKKKRKEKKNKCEAKRDKRCIKCPEEKARRQMHWEKV